ncbi:MAG TPA: proton-conducting transporter membrane subunit [Archangium sp.]|jgi:NADH-quinone oxidoreductase subunit M|uniref:proton-conducting transporter transmembrane domain-containing protein n=1 Tax=Archangium sp. TaxID=1872627 RepID=UPI002EDB5D89
MILTGLVAATAAAMTLAPTLSARKRVQVPRVLALSVVAVAMAAAPDARTGFALAAVAAALHAVGAWAASRIGGIAMWLAAVASAVAAVGAAVGRLEVAFIASIIAISVRAALVPLHAGVAELCERAPDEQVRQLASLLPLVLVHVRFLTDIPLAREAALALFLVGALASLLPALAALAQRDLKGLYRMTTVMHGGYLLCTVAAAGRGHHAAAVFSGLTLLLAVGGLGMVITALEARCGSVSLEGHGGRVGAFPHLAGAFAVLGAAGVGLPATAGFVADDLLLHAAWEESIIGTAALILASVVLAIATLRGYTRVFLGAPVRSVAPDLLPRERVVVVGIITALLVLGMAPQLIIGGLPPP